MAEDSQNVGDKWITFAGLSFKHRLHSRRFLQGDDGQEHDHNNDRKESVLQQISGLVDPLHRYQYFMMTLPVMERKNKKTGERLVYFFVEFSFSSKSIICRQSMIDDLDSFYHISSYRSAGIIEFRLYSSVNGEDVLLTTAGRSRYSK